MDIDKTQCEGQSNSGMCIQEPKQQARKSGGAKKLNEECLSNG